MNLASIELTAKKFQTMANDLGKLNVTKKTIQAIGEKMMKPVIDRALKNNVGEVDIMNAIHSGTAQVS